MLFEAIVATTIAAHLPSESRWGCYVSAPRASYLASSLVYAAGEDASEIAAMIVNIHAETGGREVYEKCLLPERGGWGTFGIAWLWEHRYPGATCGAIDVQANASHRILKWHSYEPAEAFGRYIGAKAVERHPEARRRAAMQWVVLWEMQHLACL